MYYIEEENKILLADESEYKLIDTIKFMPQYQHLEILQTDKNIVMYDGEFYFEDDAEYIAKKEQAEQERIAKLSLTKREVFLALYRAKGLTPEMIRAQITDPEALIEFDYATEYYRFNPLINQIGAMLGFSPEQIDYLFEYKSLPDGGTTAVSDEGGNIPPEPAEGEN